MKDLPGHLPNEATIVSAQIAAGHDGEADLVLGLLYPNGVEARVVLDTVTGFALMHNCGVDRLEDLTGQSWRKIIEE
jgi:hypothetical protein